MSKIEVLLSSYNGEAYIAEQLDSLSSQEHKEWTVRIRDDGSSDNTIGTIEKWNLQSIQDCYLEKGENLGVVASFFELLLQADDSKDYFCFCDQDDVWLPQKMERAIQYLTTVADETPAMIFTSTQLTDEDLQTIKIWPAAPTKQPSFYNAVYQNIAVGATVTFNRAALQLIRSHMPDTSRVLMHDWWLYICVSAFGEVLYDPEPSILYRQHGGNAVGGETSAIKKLKKKWASFRKHKASHKLAAQAREFHRLYANRMTDSEKLEQLEWFIAQRRSFLQRLKYLSNSKLYRQSPIENMLFKLLILMGYI